MLFETSGRKTILANSSLFTDPLLTIGPHDVSARVEVGHVTGPDDAIEVRAAFVMAKRAAAQ